MTKHTWTIEDHGEDLYLDKLDLRPGHVGGPAAGYHVVKRTLQTGLSKGVDVIEVDNGTFQFVVIPTRGMGLWRASLGEVQLGWRSPVRGPVHPALVNLAEEGGAGWLRGFDELLCRCGLESNGAPEFNANGTLRYGIHGRIANTPAHSVQVTIDGDTGEIAVVGMVDETRLFGPKLRLATTITTRSGPAGADHRRHNYQSFRGAGRVGTALSLQHRRAFARSRGEGAAAGEEDGAPRCGGGRRLARLDPL